MSPYENKDDSPQVPVPVLPHILLLSLAAGLVRESCDHSHRIVNTLIISVALSFILSASTPASHNSPTAPNSHLTAGTITSKVFTSTDEINVDPAMYSHAVDDVGAYHAMLNGHNCGQTMIAILDSGIHPDPRVDGNIYERKDFTKANNDPHNKPTTSPVHDHGTRIAGVIASPGRGVCGDMISADGIMIVDQPGVRILDLRVIGTLPNGEPHVEYNAVVEALNHAIDRGTQIVVMSFGGIHTSYEPFNNAIQRADAEGVVIVASTGNEGSLNSRPPASDPRILATMGNSGSRESFAPYPRSNCVTNKPDASFYNEFAGISGPYNAVSIKFNPEDPYSNWLSLFTGTSNANAMHAAALAFAINANPFYFAGPHTDERLQKVTLRSAIPVDLIEYDPACLGVGRIHIPDLIAKSLALQIKYTYLPLVIIP